MIIKKDLINLIADSIRKAQKEELLFEQIYSDSSLATYKNEFLFFLKPEITVETDSIELEKILDLIFSKIEAFGFNIHNINILSAKYLKKYKIAEQHYGVINKISSNAKLNIAESAKDKFKYLYGIDIEDIEFIGGHEYLEKFPDESSASLNYIWDSKEDAWKNKYQNLPLKEVEDLNKANNVRLAGGTYCKIIIKENIPYAVLNGFNPAQIEHFTAAGRNIVTMTLSNNLSWKEARDSFIGKTNPLMAKDGSIRRELLKNKISLGLVEVTQGMNGVHLSAGPVEALVELKRFNSNFEEKDSIKNYSEFSFGKLLLNNFRNQFEKIVENTNVEHLGKSTSVFDLTEEMDSDVALAILQSYF